MKSAKVWLVGWLVGLTELKKKIENYVCMVGVFPVASSYTVSHLLCKQISVIPPLPPTNQPMGLSNTLL